MTEIEEWVQSHYDTFGYVPASFWMGNELVTEQQVIEACHELQIPESEIA